MRYSEADAIVAKLRAAGLDAIRAYSGKRGYVVHVRRSGGTLIVQSRAEADELLAKVKVGMPAVEPPKIARPISESHP